MISTKQWTGLAASVIGHDHVRREQPLQDASTAVAAPRPAAAVCDGAGSAARSHEGARAAVREFRVAVAAMEPLLADALDEDTPEEYAEDLWRYAAGWIVRALAAAREEAARGGTGCAEDYAFTFAGAVVGRMRTGFVQIGDGALCVLGRGGQCGLVFAPEKGRFANSTNFLGNDTVERDAHLTQTLPTGSIAGLMAMSDGPAVNMLDLVHARPAPVVPRMIADCAAGELDRASLFNYLTGPRWFGDPRGGDDKSIAILACRGGEKKEWTP